MTIKEIIQIDKSGRYHFEVLRNNPRAQCCPGCACSRLHQAMGDYVLENQKGGRFEAPVSAPRWLRQELTLLAANLLRWDARKQRAYLVDREGEGKY